MRTRIVEDELRVHLDMVETEELETTGYIIATDMDNDMKICITYTEDDLSKEYDIWTSIDEYRYDSWKLKLSYTSKQEEEEI